MSVPSSKSVFRFAFKIIHDFGQFKQQNCNTPEILHHQFLVPFIGLSQSHASVFFIGINCFHY